jgi:hypothetical protein
VVGFSPRNWFGALWLAMTAICDGVVRSEKVVGWSYARRKRTGGNLGQLSTPGED